MEPSLGGGGGGGRRMVTVEVEEEEEELVVSRTVEGEELRAPKSESRRPPWAGL